MKELQAICQAYKQIDFSRQKAVLATVVRVLGSSYRSPGARMLITDNGRWVGSISGGCLEGDALRKARQVMTNQQAMTVRYDTSEEENNIFAINLGCNGLIDVLLEPVNPADEHNPVLLLESLLGMEEDAALATFFSANTELLGKKMLLNRQSLILQNFNCPAINQLVTKD